MHGTPIYCEDGNVYFINGNNLVDGKIVISAETKKVNESQQSTADKSLDDTTILMSINGTIGNLAYYSGERLMLGKSAAYIKVSEFDKRFVYAYLQAPSVQGYFMDSLTGTTIKNLGLKAIREMIMFIPQDVDEQKRIGKFFDYLDHLITLHQCKCHLLLKLLHNDWEQRKLGDLVDRVTRKNQDLVSELPLTISAQYGLIDQNEFFDKRVASKDVSGYYLIENGEFAYNKSTSTDAPWGAVKRLDRYENGVLSTLYIVFGIKENNPVDSDFLVSYYSTNLWHKGIHEIAAEGARNHGLLNIAPADFFETELTIPQDIEEQKKIGKYFEELERLITLHHRKYIYILKSP